MTATIHHGNVLDVLRTFKSDSFDALLSDPPYGLSFMGKRWDIAVPGVDVWAEALRVLKPGAYLLAFGGTRTFHRLAVAIEDAGFEIRDCLAWLYLSGFPKSLAIDKAIDAANGDERPVVGKSTRHNSNVSGSGSSVGFQVGVPVVTAAASAASAAWSGHGTALKPSYEPIIVARKPLDGTYAENALKWGVGGLAIDACRVEYADEKDMAAAAAAAQRLCHQNHGAGVGDFGLHGANAASSLDPYLAKQALGRWPGNVLLDGGAAAILDAQSGDRPGMSGGGKHRADYAGGMFGAIDCEHTARADNGGASRMFYVAKPSRFEREFGCDALPLKSAAEMTDSNDDDARLDSPRTGAGRTSGARNTHPTLKPITLISYLAKLVLPPARGNAPRRILVPFSGSGSEVIGCMRAGWEEIHGIEREEEFVTIARARIARWEQAPLHLAVDEVLRAAEKKADAAQTSLFGKVGS